MDGQSMVECPNCGEPIERAEAEVELAVSGEWVCPECGFDPLALNKFPGF